MTALKVEGLCKNFGGLKILKDVSFAAGPGEKLALIGPNGAGKSTLLNVIGGQLPASAGKITLRGKDITKLLPDKRLHLGLGRSYQVNNLFFHLPVMNNMLLALYGSQKRHFNMFQTLEKREDLLEEAERLLKAVDLWDKRSQTLGTLSYGDQRLVELLAAFTAKPKVVLLDEPSAGLPTAEALVFAEVVRRLAGDTTLIFCAHDMDLVFSLADRIMVLYFGEIIATGLPEEIKGNPRVQEIYLGSEDGTC